MQGKGTLVIHHGMAGVAAALIPHHHVIMAGEVVHHAAFSLIAPVNTNAIFIASQDPCAAAAQFGFIFSTDLL